MLFFAFILFTAFNVHGSPNVTPFQMHSYVLYCTENAVNPYFYVAWTPLASLAEGASSTSPGIYMRQQPPDSSTPQTLWTFDDQGDGTYMIYMTDPDPSVNARPLDVRDDGTGRVPYLGTIGSGSAAQKWELRLWSADGRMQIYNPH
jgi:hypothetical protein